MPAVSTQDVLSKRFVKFLSSWNTELQEENKRGLNDISKASEVIALEIMNALYGYELKQEKTVNSAGFDLCCTENQILVQVTSNLTLKKITECLRTTCNRVGKEQHLTDYELYILFLTTDRTKTDTLRNKIATIIQNNELQTDISSIVFYPSTHILDFHSFIEFIDQNTLRNEQRAQLEAVLDSYQTQIDFSAASGDRVKEIIDLYIQNYQAPLFMHTDKKTVTLKSLYVEPAFSDFTKNNSITELLTDFLWHRGREKILLLEGCAAIGKTSMVSWMCYHHANPTADNNIGLNIFCYRSIVVVRLRELDFPPGELSYDAVLRYLNIPSAKAFAERYPRAILIMDGADELGLVSNTRQNAIEKFILDVQQALAPFKTIVTSRPQYLNPRHLDSATAHLRHVTLQHFDHKRRAQWVANYKACGEILAPETEAYILDINDEDADGVADTPLALYLLSDCTMREDYKNNQWALYHTIFSEVITKAPYTALPGSGLLMSRDEATQNYNMVKAIAYRMFRNSDSERFHIDKSELDEIADSLGVDDEIADRVKDTCVLCAYWKDSNSAALEFYHNNIRDFFLAEYFCDRLAEAMAALPQVYGNQVPDSYYACPEWTDLMEAMSEIFCWTNIPNSTWAEVFTFIQLRLLSEIHQSLGDTSLYEAFSEATPMLRLMEFFPDNAVLWQARDAVHPYQAAKNAFFNVLVLFHILLRFRRESGTDTPMIRYSRFAGTLMRDWTDLFQSIFRGSDILVAPLTYSELQDVDWSTRCFYNMDFDHSQLNAANFSRGKIIQSSFREVYIRRGVFMDAQIEGGIFDHSAFSRTDFSFARISNAAAFSGCIFDLCEFYETNISDVCFSGCIFADSDFRGAALQDVSMTNCRINGENTKLDHRSFKNVRTENCTYHNVHKDTAKVLRSIGFTEAATR